jgi:hypothetical protein
LRDVLGEENGFLFTGYDALAVPGEETAVRVRLQRGSLLRDCPDMAVRFADGGRTLGHAVTDDEGCAAVRFRPPAPGDYTVTARVASGSPKHVPPGPVEVLVACREADAPLLVVDLDKTLVASGIKTVLVGDPAAMPQSVEVMNQLARRFTPVYLTHRLDYFGPKSKAWLREHGYPRGPVLLAEVREFLKGSGEFKSDTLQHLRRRFRGRLVGIGDKISDAKAYHANGLEALLLVRTPENADAGDLRSLARSVRSLPEGVQVVAAWDEIRQALLEGVEFPRLQFEGRLLARAEQLRGAGKTPKSR